jgi:hypothetical protein
MKSETPQPANIGDVHSNEPGSGARYNAGKPAFELVPLVALEDCAKVFDYGRQRYAPWDWAKGMPWSAPLGCLLRHLSAWQRGEDNDPESGLPHLGHVMANLVMLTTYARTYPQGDDRTEWLKEAAAQKEPPDRIRPECGTGYLARWANAPEWAQWLSQDADGACAFRADKPFLHRDFFRPESSCWRGGHMYQFTRSNLLGRVACEPRPENVIDPKREAYLKRWNQIPQWANYLTQDVNGANTIWAHRPEKSPLGDTWVVSSNEPNSRFSHFFDDGHALGLGYFGCEVRPGLTP